MSTLKGGFLLNTATARVGASSRVITEALYAMHPEWRTERDLVDDLRLTALYAECGAERVCLLSYDVCELPRHEADRLRKAVASGLGIDKAAVHVYCTHTHSSSMNAGDHDLALLSSLSREAALYARHTAVNVEYVEHLRVDTGGEFNINRRTQPGPLGVWCLMQSRGCTEEDTIIDGTEWVRHKMQQWGASPEETAGITGPYPATRPRDTALDLVAFPDPGGGYAGALVRFNAHAVVCSAGYWKPNLGRDYPGVLCYRLCEALRCPVLFLQGPCGDHRPRHRNVGLSERDRIGNGLADALLNAFEDRGLYPFDTLCNTAARIAMPLSPRFPVDAAAAKARIVEIDAEIAGLPAGPEHLMRRKALQEERAFVSNALACFRGESYLTPAEITPRTAPFDLSCVSFGPLRLLNYPGEMFSSVVTGLEEETGVPLIVTSFADGVTGYLMPPEEVLEGGYESTWALFDPDAVAQLRRVGIDLAGSPGTLV